MNKDGLLYHYFSNSLSKAQEEQLQELLKTDVDFKKQFEFETNLRRVAKEERHKGLQSKLNQFESNISSNKTSQKSSFSFLKIAASIVVLISASWLGYQSFFGLNYADLFTENYNTYPNTVYTITRSDTINSLEREAFVAYEAEDYELALEKFNSAASKDYFNFYKGQSYLRLNNNEEAKSLFEIVIKKNEKFVGESHWYLALIHLKDKNKQRALDNLEQLVANFDYKTADAQKLIKKLD